MRTDFSDRCLLVSVIKPVCGVCGSVWGVLLMRVGSGCLRSLPHIICIHRSGLCFFAWIVVLVRRGENVGVRIGC